MVLISKAKKEKKKFLSKYFSLSKKEKIVLFYISLFEKWMNLFVLISLSIISVGSIAWGWKNYSFNSILEYVRDRNIYNRVCAWLFTFSIIARTFAYIVKVYFESREIYTENKNENNF